MLIWMKEITAIMTLICFCIAFSVIAGCMQTYAWRSETVLVRLDKEGSQQWSAVIENQGYSPAVHYYENWGIQTSDGGFFVAGTFYNDSYGNMIRAIKIDGRGNVIWNTIYSRSHGSILALFQCPDGRYLILTHGGYVYCIDDQGRMAWEKSVVDQLTRKITTDLVVNAAAQAPDGSILLAATKYSRSENLNIACFSYEGILLWERVIDYPDLETVRSIATTSDGGYIVGGLTFEQGAQYPAQGRILVVKMDANATVVWDVFLAETNSSLLDMHEQPDRGYTILYAVEDSGKNANNSWKIVEVLISHDGAIEEERIVPLTEYPKHASDQGFILISFSPIQSQGFFSMNRTNLDLAVRKVDSSGDAQWNTTIPWVSTPSRTSNVIHEVLQTDDGGYALLGGRYFY